jgi:PST family polysaccharide transporter
MLAIGRNVTGFSIINYFSRNLDNLLIGKVWGSQQLGFYSRAYQLLLLPIDQINAPIGSVAVPALSRLHGSPERYRRSYLRILEKIAMITMPGMALMIATADWLVGIGLGAQWSGTAPILAVLGLAGLVQPIANTVGWLLISQGRTRHMLQWGFIGSTIVIISILGGLHWGAMGVAISYSCVVIAVVVPLLFWFAGREGPIKTGDFYRTIAPAALASVCVLGAVSLMRVWVAINSPILGLVLGSLIAASVALVVLASMPRGRRSLRDVRETLTLLTGGH